MKTNLLFTLPFFVVLLSCGHDETFNNAQSSIVSGEWRWVPPSDIEGLALANDSCMVDSVKHVFIKCTWSDYLLAPNGNFWRINRSGVVLTGIDYYSGSSKQNLLSCIPIRVDSSWSEEGTWWNKDDEYYLKLGEQYETLWFSAFGGRVLINGRRYTSTTRYY